MRIGGRDTIQTFTQQRTSLRNDYTRYGRWRGTHMMKSGAIVSFLNYDVNRELLGNPLFRFRSSTGFSIPSEASYGVGQPDLSAKNSQIGFFVQDDWALTSRVTLNAGLRWDYESDMLNNDYVTPDYPTARPPRPSSIRDGTSLMETTGPPSTAPGSRVSVSHTISSAMDGTCCSAARAGPTTASSTTPGSTSATGSGLPCACFASPRPAGPTRTASTRSRGIPRS